VEDAMVIRAIVDRAIERKVGRTVPL